MHRVSRRDATARIKDRSEDVHPRLNCLVVKGEYQQSVVLEYPPAFRKDPSQAGLVERIRLGDPDVVRLAPQPRRAIERAGDDRDEENDEG